MTVHIGTSGWQYAHWRERFYPHGVPQGRWLEHYAERFDTVESNNAFYRLPERSVFEAWARRTPEHFVMAVKVSRYLTHIKRLSEPEEPVERFVGRVRGLGRKLGPVLLQLPPSMRVDAGRLRETLERFPRDMRVAVEPRHATWEIEEVRMLLADHGAALCLADRKGLLGADWRTADWAYVRFHEGLAHPRPCYEPAALTRWAERIADTWGQGADVFVYFNNDPQGCAIHDARLFAAEARRAGLETTRVPHETDYRVG